MKNLLLLIFLVQAILAGANTFHVGADKDYISPNALYIADVIQDGDTIEIDAETYIGEDILAVWHPNNLVIKGVGGQPHLMADGAYIWGKGIWVLVGDNITVENIKFSDATVPDQNGAGIRLDGVGLTVRHCYFLNNENGILVGNPYDGDILIEYSVFSNGGYGNGYSHNLYIGHVNKLTFQFNYTHHAKIGHTLKSRAKENYILYNRIMDEETGNSSRLIDLSNGGVAIIMGNLFMQGQNAENNNFVGYGKEGLSNDAPHELYFINNTLVNKRIGSCLFLDIKEGTSVAHVANNIFAGGGTIVNGQTTAMDNNVIEADIETLKFVDEENYDYHLNADSPAVDVGIDVADVNNYSLTPTFVYIHPQIEMARMVANDVIDVGAYEYGTVVAQEEVDLVGIEVYPNPTASTIHINHGEFQIKKITIYNQKGKAMHLKTNAGVIDLSPLPFGGYFLKLEIKGHLPVIKYILKI